MNTSVQAPGGLSALLGNAQAAGALSPASMAAINIHDIGADIQNALGIDVQGVTASEVTLVTQLIDDSGSIRMSGNSQVVRDGYNLVIDSLAGSKQRDGIMAMCRYLNGTTLNPYGPITQTPRMDSSNYNPSGGTPLYDQSIATLAAVAAKSQDFLDNGIDCRTVTLIVTDGADVHSHKRASDVKQIVTDLLRQECHIVAFMGIDDGMTDFRAIALSMGIPDEWILTPGNSASEIRKAFAMFSQSATRASQNAGSFSASAMGGFGSP